MVPSVFQSFLERSPICVMAQAVLENLFQPQRLDALFARHAQSQYQRTLLFSSVVELMQSVVLGIEPTVYAAYRKRRHRLQVSDQAVYDKLAGMELGLSAALVEDSARQARDVIDALGARHQPWLAGYRVRLLDGNALSATEHRLEELRGTWAAPLPGKALVVLEPETGLATDVFLTPDGHAQERTLLDEILARVQKRDLWIADRTYCTLKFLAGLIDRQAFFVVRQHGAMSVLPQGTVRPRGRCATGTLREQAVQISYEGRTYALRRITLHLQQPTRSGETVLQLLTNLPAKVSARRVSDLYYQRWTIEHLFYEVSTTLTCEVDTLCYPQAALFVFCLALVAANAVAILKAALRAAHDEESVAALSGYYLALEVQQVHPGLMIAVPRRCWDELAALSTAALAQRLLAMAKRVPLDHYHKSVRGPKKPPPPKDRYRNGGHVSTHRLLEARKA
jgi:hypothetical protein